MNTNLQEISSDYCIRRAQIPLREDRFTYLTKDYIPKANDTYCMVHQSGHFLIYEQKTGYCLFDASYILFEKTNENLDEENPIIAVIHEFKTNTDSDQFPNRNDDDFGLLADLIEKAL